MKTTRIPLLRKSLLCAALLLACTAFPVAQAAPSLSTESSALSTPLTPWSAGVRNLTVHDPSTIVQCNNEYWVFATGIGVRSAHSTDLVNWQIGPRVMNVAPPWVADTVPNNRRNDCWAPDVMKVGDKYLLYYAVSTFGSPISGIGLITTPTLDPADKSFKWTDQGLVIKSQRSDNFNAIDPAVARDADGGLWLAFGSYWSGIKLIQLDPASGKRIAPDSKIYSLAHNSSIEAAYIYHHDHSYYLFVNWGRCCAGPNSTYNIRVGRSEKITGPYLDKAGTDMLNNGGSVVVQNEDQFIGPGHAGIITVNGQEWFSMHYEFAGPAGRRTPLAIRPLSWDHADWPIVERVPGQATSATAPTTRP